MDLVAFFKKFSAECRSEEPFQGRRDEELCEALFGVPMAEATAELDLDDQTRIVCAGLLLAVDELAKEVEALKQQRPLEGRRDLIEAELAKARGNA